MGEDRATERLTPLGIIVCIIGLLAYITVTCVLPGAWVLAGCPF